MISEVFFQSKIKKESYIYTVNFLNYCIDVFVYKHNIKAKNEIVENLLIWYDKKIVNRSKLNAYVKNYLGKKKLIDNKVAFAKLEEIHKNLDYNLNNSQDYLFKNLFNSIYYSSDAFLPFEIILSIQIKKGLFNKNIGLAILYNIIKNYDKYACDLEKNFMIVPDSLYKVEIMDIFDLNETEKELIYLFNINSIFDLKKVDYRIVMIIFFSRIEQLLIQLDTVSKNIGELFEEIYNILSEREWEIIILRTKHFSEKETLASIGAKYNLTRERIRQIEKNARKKLTNQLKKHNVFLNSIFYQLNSGKNYLSLDDIINFYVNKYDTKIIISCFSNFESRFKYDENYKLIYDCEKFNIESLINDELNNFGYIVMISDKNKIDSFQNAIIKKHYKKIGKELYLSNEKNKIYLYENILNEAFPNGFKIGEEETYIEFIKYFKRKYNDKIVPPTFRSIQAAVDRMNFCQIDKGTYLSKKDCVKLPEELITKLMSYIQSSNKSAIYYESLFYKFEDELLQLGIKNRYYLKGLLDDLLPEYIYTQRDFLSIGSKFNTPYNEIVKVMKGFDGAFKINEINKMFPGISEYVYLYVIAEETKKDLLVIGRKKYIYKDKFYVDEIFIKKLGETVEKVFNEMKTKIISANKVYVKMYILYNRLLNKIDFIEGPYEIYCLLRILFPKYHYNWPLIGKEKITDNSSWNLVENYIRKLDEFSIDDIKKYTNFMNIDGISNYLELLDNLVGDYIQININTMVIKEKIQIDSSKLKKLKNRIDLFLNTIGEIDTRTFNGYQLLPKINYAWNKYLLSSVLKVFLKNKYDIENTSKTYNNNDYIIRRKV